MDPKEATKVARHHLGDRYHWHGRGGPHADSWIVQAVPIDGLMIVGKGDSVEAAARDAADQLRAQGWTPTHARLEWRRDDGEAKLVLCAGVAVAPLWWIVQHEGSRLCFAHTYCDVEPVGTDYHKAEPSEVLAGVAEWCAANLPSLWLPPFPGDSK
jgi:hypothetical protein